MMTRADLEQRRLVAAEDLTAGMPQADIARKFLVSRTTASRWAQKLAAGDLRARKATGRRCRLTTVQLEELAEIYRNGMRWTQNQVVKVILERFGVRYDQDHVGKMLIKLGLHTPRTRRAVGTGRPRVSTAAPGAGGGA